MLLTIDGFSGQGYTDVIHRAKTPIEERILNMKRLFAALLSLALVIGMLPGVFAQETATETTVTGTTVTAQEVNGIDRLPSDASTAETEEPQPSYNPDELVTVIVELSGTPVLEGFAASDVTVSSNGAAVAAYLASPAVSVQRASLSTAQNVLIAALGSDVTVNHHWTNVINAISITVPYSRLAQIKGLPGVKRAYVEHTYSLPEEQESDTDATGTYSYSYSMAGVSDAWSQGYTGQGMLIAVLDSGLDMQYAVWGDSADPQVGVRRVHEAFSNNSFKSDVEDLNLRYTNESLELFLQNTQLHATTGSDGSKITWDNNALYKNLKVPYACDYGDGDNNVMPSNSDHGTHVSGTIAGYAESEDGGVIFSGIAPDAQIAFMKIFSDSSEGATDSAIMCALEDAAALGADVINLSIGADNGFAEDDTAANDVYARLRDAGIVFMTSAGNSAYSSYGNNYGGYNLADDTDISMMSAPAVYPSNLAVASINNTITAQSVMTWTDSVGTEHTVPFSDPFDVAMKQTLGTGSYQIIVVDGYGTYSDYYNAGFRNYYGYGEKGVSGIALVKRGGGISFEDKINAATNFVWSYYDSASYNNIYENPVKAVIIYDEDAESTELIYMGVDNALMTSCFISGVDGHALAAAAKEGEVYITVQPEDQIIEAEDGNQMSSFSSWGAGPGLELKPEITAPGGNIWSAVVDQNYTPSSYAGTFDDYTGSYAMMSGTSMAAPHMTGITALTQQYIRTELGLTEKNAVATLAQRLLVSTAVPQTTGGTYYSPRLQGAGLVNLGAAISTPAYITVEGQDVGKLELKDDPSKSGVYHLEFEVNNLSNAPVTYNVTATLLRPGTTVDESGNTLMLDSDVTIQEVALGTVTVAAGQTVTVRQDVTLTAEEKAQLDQLFPNGTYVEGFIVLTDAAQENPQIGLPFLAYYGDWTASPIFDRNLWYDEPADGENVMNNESTWGTTFVGFAGMMGYINLGQNLFDPYFGEQMVYHTENFSLSPNGDGYLDSVNDFVLYQLRDAKLIVVEVTDTDTGEVYYRDFVTYLWRSLYYATYGYAIPASQMYFTETSWDGTDLDGNVLPSGTHCTMTITAYGEGDYGDTIYEADAGRFVTDFEAVASGEVAPTYNGHDLDMTGDVITFPITIDTVAPKLENNTVSIYEQDGRIYMPGTVYDVDGSIASVAVHPYVCRTYQDGYGDPSMKEYGIDDDNPFYTEHVYDAATKTLTFTADVTEYAHTNESWSGENYYYNFTWTGNVFISCGDYGLNDRTYAVTVTQGDGIVLSQTSALLYVGSEFDLSVIDNTFVEGELIRESSNPEVATIDEYGHIEALSPGQTTITVTKGDFSAVCIVAVREKPTEVIDFKLSIESFSGLKPNGTVVVKVTDLEPANVELYQKHWIINEDDPDLYAGLINVAQYDTTGLAGEVYLNYAATNDPSVVVPGASATLSVTLNGVTRTMTINWEDLYTYSNDDDLVSGMTFGDQVLYVTQGETAGLVAKYNNSSAHNVCNVELCTAVGVESYTYNNPLDPAVGLVLDGPDFAPTNSSWTAKIVNTEGYALPENIRLFTRYTYSDGSYYESEIINYSYNPSFSYNSATGVIEVYSTPYSETNTLVIRADGVESEGNPAGSLSGETYERPDGIYGPFDWEVVSGSGELTTAEGVTVGYETQNLAYYTPAEPGVSVIKATTKDGKYSLNFAVVSQAVLPESLTLSSKNLTLNVGDTATVEATATPEPTEAQYAEVTWTSYNPEVATVDAETGVITAVSAGYAYIRASLEVASGLETYCIVQVLPCEHASTTTTTVEATCTEDGYISVTCDTCGAELSHEVLPAGHSYEAVVTAPDCLNGGYTTYTCTVCGDSYVADETEALGHDFVITLVAPDCDHEGYSLHSCTRCDYSFRDNYLPMVDCPSKAFADLSNDKWYHEAVDYVLNTGLMKGIDATTFAPNAAMTRAQLVTVLYRMAGSPAASEKAPFTDVVEGSYYEAAVAWAYETGIAKGFTADTFAPNASITREQMVTFFARYAQLQGVDTTMSGDLSAYADGSSVGAYARTAMAWAIETGLIQGVKDSYLAPKDTATRAQVATVLMRYSEIFH